MAEIKKKYSKDEWMAPHRLKGESFEDYKKRRKAVKIAVDKYLKGRYIWYSKNPTDLMMGKTDTSWGTMTPEKVEIVKDEINKFNQEKEEEDGRK